LNESGTHTRRGWRRDGLCAEHLNCVAFTHPQQNRMHSEIVFLFYVALVFFVNVVVAMFLVVYNINSWFTSFVSVALTVEFLKRANVVYCHWTHNWAQRHSYVLCRHPTWIDWVVTCVCFAMLCVNAQRFFA
jgi:hypothetical protein